MACDLGLGWGRDEDADATGGTGDARLLALEAPSRILERLLLVPFVLDFSLSEVDEDDIVIRGWEGAVRCAVGEAVCDGAPCDLTGVAGFFNDPAGLPNPWPILFLE